MFSVEGITYIPRGQCDLATREAYSSETAVRVTGLTSTVWEVVADAVNVVLARDFREFERVSPVEEAKFNGLNMLIVGRWWLLG